ncbi:MAG: peptidoglycan-associated lipoprotein [Porticoccus sp.]
MEKIMKTQLLKYGVMATFLAALLAGCSSTDTTDTFSAGGATSIPSNQVSTGTADSAGISGSSLDSDSSVSRVFYFEFDRAILNSEARAALRIHAQTLRKNPVNIRLEGHADERGTREYNMALAERRANSARDFLVQEGVNGALIEVISYGEESPTSVDSNKEFWTLNRRVELK